MKNSNLAVTKPAPECLYPGVKTESRLFLRSWEMGSRLAFEHFNAPSAASEFGDELTVRVELENFVGASVDDVDAAFAVYGDMEGRTEIPRLLEGRPHALEFVCVRCVSGVYAETGCLLSLLCTKKGLGQ